MLKTKNRKWRWWRSRRRRIGEKFKISLCDSSSSSSSAEDSFDTIRSLSPFLSDSVQNRNNSRAHTQRASTDIRFAAKQIYRFHPCAKSLHTKRETDLNKQNAFCTPCHRVSAERNFRALVPFPFFFVSLFLLVCSTRKMRSTINYIHHKTRELVIYTLHINTNYCASAPRNIEKYKIRKMMPFTGEFEIFM